MKLTIKEALKDGLEIALLGTGYFLKYYFGYMMLMGLTLVFAIVLVPSVIPSLEKIGRFRVQMILSPPLFTLGYILSEMRLSKDLNKRMTHASEYLEARMRASDFWNPLFSKKKLKTVKFETSYGYVEFDEKVGK